MALYRFVDEKDTKSFTFIADEGTKKQRQVVVNLVEVDSKKNLWGRAIRCDQGGSFVKITK